MVRFNPKEAALRDWYLDRPIREQREREEARRQLTDRIDQVEQAEDSLQFGSTKFQKWASDLHMMHHPASVHHPPTPTQVAEAVKDLRQRVVMTMFREFVRFRMENKNLYIDFKFEFESREEEDAATRINISVAEEVRRNNDTAVRQAMVMENEEEEEDDYEEEKIDENYAFDCHLREKFETFATTIDGATVDVIDHAKSIRAAFFALKRFKDERILAPGSNNREMIRAKEEFETTCGQLVG